MLGYVRDNSKQQTEQFNQQDKRLTKQAFHSPMASTSTQIAPSTTASSTHSKNYEVFLSFRGADTRFGFTDHLYEALKRIGISVFRDTEELEEGEEIYPSLKEAIEQSQYAVVVISEKFAESKSCLFELTVIMECRQMGRLTVFPIFYYVDPSSVRNQKGTFGDAFFKLNDDPKVDTEKWESWKAVLTKIGDCSLDPSKVDEDPLESCRGALEKVGNLSGWHVQDRYETKIVEDIGLKIFSQLIRNSRDIDESLIGIESPVRKIMELLNSKSNSDCFIGICGMGGIGKTTLANIVYERASPKFEAHCNIYNIGERKNGDLVALQRQLIYAILSKKVEKSLSTDHDVMMALKSRLRSKKVLIVLDDVCHGEQLKKLAGSDNWFGEGSRIIITSREQHFPPYLHGDNIFVVNELNCNDSLQLFCSKAFKNCHL